MLERFAINAERLNETLNSVLNKAEKVPKCKGMMEEKNNLFERKPDAQDALLELDELLSDYYGEVLKIMFVEIAEQIIRIFYSSDSSVSRSHGE